MSRTCTGIGLSLVGLVVTGAMLGAAGKSKPGPMTGTWECVAHGTSQGDLPFTLNLQQNQETVTGTVGTAQGEAAITTATYKKHGLDIHVETPQGTYRVTGKFRDGQLSGTWSKNDHQKGTWEGKKAPAARPQTR